MISVGESYMHWLPVPGKVSAHCLLASKSARRTQYSQALSGTMLYLQTAGQYQLLQWASVIPCGQHRAICALIERPLCPPGRWQIWQLTRGWPGVDQVPHEAQTSRKNKRAFFEPETEKIFLHKVKSLTQDMWTIYILVGKYSKLRAHFWMSCGGIKRWVCEIDSPNNLLPSKIYG